MRPRTPLAHSAGGSHPVSLRNGLKKAWPEWLIQETVARYDRDGDRQLDREEWRRAFAVLSMPADKVQKKNDAGFLLVPLRAADAGDAHMLSTLRTLLDTDPKNLGTGRDCRSWGPYDRLHLARAWRIDDDSEAAKYEVARDKVKGDMEMLQSKGKAAPRLSTPVRTASACTAPVRPPRFQPAPAPRGRLHTERARGTNLASTVCSFGRGERSRAAPRDRGRSLVRHPVDRRQRAYAASA